MSLSRQALEAALDKAIAIPARHIDDAVARMRRERPGADTAELIELAADRFRRDAGLSSGAVGASAALPAIGTGTAAALTAGQTAVFLASAVRYVLTVAELQGMRVVTPERRRALLLSALMGRDGAEAIEGSLGLGTVYWAAQNLSKLPMPTLKSINKQLTQRMAKRAALRGGGLALGRLLPFGVGMVIGWTGGRALANQVIEGAHAALGPAADIEQAEQTRTVIEV